MDTCVEFGSMYICHCNNIVLKLPSNISHCSRHITVINIVFNYYFLDGTLGVKQPSSRHKQVLLCYIFQVHATQ